MAHLRVESADLVVELSTIEKAEAFHGNIRVPLTSIQDVLVVHDPWPHLRGIRAPGTGIPDVIAVGTRRGSFGKDFAAVHGRGAAVVVELSDADYARLVVTTDAADELAATINAARGSATRS